MSEVQQFEICEAPLSRQTVLGLVKRRAFLAGEIERLHDNLAKMLADLETLDATILQFDGDYNVEAISPKKFRPPKDWSHRGQMTRIVLNVLRVAREPMTTREIAFQMIVERALNREDQKLMNLMVKRVGVALRHQRNQGRAESEQGPGQFMLWHLVK
jgi:dGTP triphosphohydrolase